jgi:hypothetical protein
MNTSFVYVLRPRGLPIVKVGCSVDPESRRSVFQRLWTIPLDLCSRASGSLDAERDLHRKLASWRIDGEWFLLCPAVDLVLSEHGLSTGGDAVADPILGVLCSRIEKWIASHQELSDARVAETVAAATSGAGDNADISAKAVLRRIDGDDVRRMFSWSTGDHVRWGRSGFEHLQDCGLLLGVGSPSELGRVVMGFAKRVFFSLETSLVSNDMQGWRYALPSSGVLAALLQRFHRARFLCEDAFLSEIEETRRKLMGDHA